MYPTVKKKEDCLVNAYRSGLCRQYSWWQNSSARKYKEKGKSATDSWLGAQIRKGTRVEVTFETMVVGVFKTE